MRSPAMMRALLNAQVHDPGGRREGQIEYRHHPVAQNADVHSIGRITAARHGENHVVNPPAEKKAR